MDQKPPAIKVHETGITIIYNPRDTPVVDIVFVHGLQGHPRKTWTAVIELESPSNPSQKGKDEKREAFRSLFRSKKKEKGKATEKAQKIETFWPEELLPVDCPNARILTAGYDSKVSHFFNAGANQNNVFAHGRDLLYALNLQRQESQNRPLIFLAHSLGGIITKEIIRLASFEKDPLLHSIFTSTIAVFFLGTPHRGSNWTELGDTLRRIAKVALFDTAKQNIDALKIDDSVLAVPSQMFLQLYEEHHFKVRTFQEAKGFAATGLFNLNDKVVSDFSSYLTGGLSEHPTTINANHMNMCRFESRDDPGYRSVVGEIKLLMPAEKREQTQNSSQTVNVDKYLESIALPSIFVSEMGAPKHQVTVSMSSNIRASLDWFIKSPEFETWISRKSSSFLWCSGIPKSGKTVLSCYLEKYLRSGQTWPRRDVIAIFCTSNKEHSGSIEIERILGCIASQLLHRDDNRLKCASQKHPPKRWFPAHPPLSFEEDYQNSLWRLIWDSITASSDCEIFLILDGVNEIRPEQAREAFLTSIVTLFDRVKSEIGITIRVFVTSLPFEDIRRAFKDVPSIEKDKERQECLRILRFEEYNARQNRVLTAEENTGDWILTHRAFKTWDESLDSRLLWLRGKPGSGKSTLTKRVVVSKTIESTQPIQTKSHNTSHSNPEKTTTHEEVDTEYVDYLATDRDIIVAAFFYNFRGGMTETNHTLMLRSLLYQILKGNSKVFPSFRSTYRKLSKTEGSPQWSYEDLKSVFMSLRSIQTPLKIYIVVDAMDESDEGQRPEILNLLSTICSSKSSCIFKGLIASRPHYDIRTRLNKWDYISLQDENRRDIETVIIKGLKHLSENQKISQDKLDRVRNYLIKHCDGVFLWISIVLRELEELVVVGISGASLKDLLESLPSDLMELYKHIVKKIEAKHNQIQKRGKKMLVWTAFAERPMTMEEFGDAVIIPSDPEPFTPTGDFISEARISPFEPLIANCCGGLLEIRPGNIVQLLHQTTRDFILDKSRAAKPFDTDELQGDTEIAIVCLRYLGLILQLRGGLQRNEMQETDCQDFVNELSDRPLLDYTLAFLPTHLNNLTRDNHDVPKFVDDELTRLVQVLQKSPQSQAYSLLERWWEEDLGRPIGLKIDLEFAKQSRNAMLITATREGHESVVTSLLTAHAEINGGWSDLFPIEVAASKGHQAVVRLLLEKGADVGAKDGDRGTALHRAAENGHEAVVRLLLEKGADVGAKDGDRGTALHRAAENGHEAVVRLLLEKGADVDSEDKAGQTALHRAAENGHEAVIELLLATGKVNVNSKNGYDRTALSWAAGNGHEAVIELLLATGKVDVDSKDGYGRTALSWAARNGHEAVMELLLATGKVDVDSKDRHGRTPLSWAAKNGHETVIKLLLATGKVNVDFKDTNGQTALSWAAENGHEAVIELLLATGKVNVDFKDGYGRTALSWAAGNGHEAVIELLLTTGKVDVDSKDTNGQTPLSWAAGNGHEAVIELLLATGKVDVDSKDRYGQTPLSWAARNGHEAVVKLLQSPIPTL